MPKIKFSFLESLSNILDNSEYTEIITWTENGDKIQILNWDRFKNVLFTTRGHSSISAFKRVMSSYNFIYKKNTFHNIYFTRDNKEFEKIRKPKKGFRPLLMNEIEDLDSLVEIKKLKMENEYYKQKISELKKENDEYKQKFFGI